MWDVHVGGRVVGCRGVVVEVVVGVGIAQVQDAVQRQQPDQSTLFRVQVGATVVEKRQQKGEEDPKKEGQNTLGHGFREFRQKHFTEEDHGVGFGFFVSVLI